jgi:hypothetical protein
LQFGNRFKYRDERNGMKKTIWQTPNKMGFVSGHKTFDKQTNLITTGNVISNTQLSFYIRAYNTSRNPVGTPVEKGAMQEFDLRNFKNLPGYVSDAVRSLAKARDIILYEFHHYSGSRKIVDGYVLTTGANTGHKLLRVFYTGSGLSRKAVDEAIKYITGKNARW